MRFAAALAILVIVVSLQTAVLPALTILGAHPQLLLVVAMLWTIVRGPDEGRVVVFSTALLHGLLASAPAGFPLIAMAPVIPLAMLRDAGFVSSRFVMALLLVGIATLFYEALYTLLLTITEGGVNPLVTGYRVYLPAVIVNVAFVPVVYFLLHRLSWDLRARRY